MQAREGPAIFASERKVFVKQIKASIEVLSREELLLIHNAALKTLDRVGLRVPNDEVLSMCADLGCKIDPEKKVVKFPTAVMEQFIDGMRAESTSKPEDRAHKLRGQISTQVSLVDYKTGTRRYGLRDDNLKNIKLVEKLKNIPVCSAAVVPSDVPYEVADVVSVTDIQKYSTKPGGTYILTPFGAKYISEINRLLGLRDNYLLESISPLSFKQDTVEMALAFAKNGGSLSIAPMAMSSTTAPVTLSGTLVIETAEVLGSSFLVHMMTGEYPGFGASCHSVDPRSTLCSFGSPNQALFGAAVSQLGKFYGIQGGTNTGLTDALVPDFQGGLEKGITAAFNSLGGLCSIGCQGIVGADQGFSYEQLVIDNEWIDYYNYIVSGFEVSEEHIGYDMIEEVGIGGNFLGEEHTVEYLRESYWVSDLFNRDDWSNWTAKGSKSILDKAHEFVEAATAGYRDMEPVRSPGVCEELDRILREALREAASRN